MEEAEKTGYGWGWAWKPEGEEPVMLTEANGNSERELDVVALGFWKSEAGQLL